jgi:hypothetical protein
VPIHKVIPFHHQGETVLITDKRRKSILQVWMTLIFLRTNQQTSPSSETNYFGLELQQARLCSVLPGIDQRSSPTLENRKP